MSEDHLEIIHSCTPGKESVLLAERIARFGCLEFDLKTGRYLGTGFAHTMLGITGKPCPRIEDILPFVHPDDRERVRKLHESQYDGKSYTDEFRVVVNGQIRYLHTAGEILFDEQGKPFRTVGFVQEITEQKLEQQAKEKSEQQYRALFHDACYAISLMRPDGTFVECNQKTLELYHAGNEESFFEYTFASLAPPKQPCGMESGEKAKERFQAALAAGHQEFEWLAQRVDGEPFWAFISLTRLCLDGKDLLQIILRDIDKEKHSLQLLQESEMRKEFIIKNAGLTMWVWDVKTGIAKNTNQDSPLAKIFPEEGISVERFIENIHEEDRKVFRKKTYDLLMGKIVNPEYEYRYPKPDGQWVWLKTNAMVVDRDENGNAKVIIGFHQDITEQRKYEHGLLEAKKITEEANRAKSLFLANMSHEIRTPMTAILGYLDLICDAQISATEREEYAQTMRRNGIHLLDLINEILDLSKIESGQIDVNADYTSTTQLIDNVAGPLEALAQEKGISLVVDYATEVPEKIWTDARFLRQILWNIIGNAIKFTTEGEVRIIIEHIPAAKRHAKVGEKKSALKISIEDTGCGIPPDRLESIFEPFVQADATTTRQFGGTGLGLAIARRQIEMLAGTIRAWNNLNGGSTFEIVHPLEKTEGVPLIRPEKTFPSLQQVKVETDSKNFIPTTLEGIRILLAEDGMDNQRLISTVLRKAHATVDIANNGLEAIEMVQTVGPQEYDVILMDMQMPLLDGYATTSKLREMKLDIPIIALTAHAMSGDRKKCLESGCDSYCTKPIRPQKLVALIAQYVKSKLPSQETGDR